MNHVYYAFHNQEQIAHDCDPWKKRPDPYYVYKDAPIGSKIFVFRCSKLVSQPYTLISIGIKTADSCIFTSVNFEYYPPIYTVNGKLAQEGLSVKEFLLSIKEI